MSQNPGIYSSMGQTYTNQIGSINFTGYTYVYSAATITVQPSTSNGKTNFINVTSNPSAVPITVGNHIVGPSIPVGTIITQDLGGGIYKVSKPQTQGGGGVSGYVCIGTPIQYGQVIASAPAYGSSSYAGKLDFYAPSSGKPSAAIMTLTNGNVGIGKTQPLRALDLSGAMTIMNGNLAIGTSNQIAGPGLALDVSGAVSFLNGYVGIGTQNPQSTLDVTGSCNFAKNGNRYIELAGDSNLLYIDIHSQDINITDYDTRILSIGGTASSGGGELYLYGGNINLNSTGVNSAGPIAFTYNTLPTFTSNQIGYIYDFGIGDTGTATTSTTAFTYKNIYSTAKSIPAGVYIMSTRVYCYPASGQMYVNCRTDISTSSTSGSGTFTGLSSTGLAGGVGGGNATFTYTDIASIPTGNYYFLIFHSTSAVGTINVGGCVIKLVRIA